MSSNDRNMTVCCDKCGIDPNDVEAEHPTCTACRIGDERRALHTCDKVEQPTEPHPAREDNDVDASVSEPISPYGKTTIAGGVRVMDTDRYVTGDEISRFEARVMSVGHGVLSDDEWRRLIDTLEATQREVATLRAKLSERRTHIVNGITRNSRQRQANARIQRQYEAMRAERDSYAFEMRSERARADITEAEVERMRPVVANALEWRDNWPARNAMQWDNGCEADLCAAVDAFRATIKKETTDA